MTKQKLKKEIIKISSMKKTELNKYVQHLFLVKHDVKEKAFKSLIRACDLQQMHLEEVAVSPMCIVSELREGEL